MSGRLAYAPAEPTPPSTLPRQQNWASRSRGEVGRLATPTDVRAFGPLEHLRILHGAQKMTGCPARVSFGQRTPDNGDPWTQWAVDQSEAPHIAKLLVDQGEAVDLYATVNAFSGGRRLANLRSIHALFSDVDYHRTTAWKWHEPRVVLVAILSKLEAERIPFPSLVLDSGRGFYLYWLHERLPARARCRWDLVQARIQEVLADFGADPKAKDAARVLRVAGSLNSKASAGRRTVSLFWLQGTPSEPMRFKFDSLADVLLPYTRDQIVSLRAARAAGRAEGRSKAGPSRSRLDSASYGEAVLEDLHRLRRHRHPKGILPTGARDVWLFCASMALAWTCPPEVLESETVALAQSATGWTSRQAKSAMGAVMRRARAAAAGKRIRFAGKEVDPRYRMKAATIVDWLEIGEEEQRAAGLRILLSPEMRRTRKAEQERDRRARAGATSHAKARETRRKLGNVALYRMAKEGLTRDEMARELGVSSGLLSKAIREAREAS